MLPGVWVPTRFRNIVFDNNGHERKLDGKGFLSITRIRVNEQVPDSIFATPNLPGTMEILSNGKVAQRTPGGTEHLSEIVAWLNKGRRTTPADRGMTEALEARVEYGADVLFAVGILLLLGRTARPHLSRRNHGDNRDIAGTGAKGT